MKSLLSSSNLFRASSDFSTRILVRSVLKWLYLHQISKIVIVRSGREDVCWAFPASNNSNIFNYLVWKVKVLLLSKYDLRALWIKLSLTECGTVCWTLFHVYLNTYKFWPSTLLPSRIRNNLALTHRCSSGGNSRNPSSSSSSYLWDWLDGSSLTLSSCGTVLRPRTFLDSPFIF